MLSETIASQAGAPETARELTDPRAMRALAHPVRLAILDVLQAEATATATECARATEQSPQSCSYHLRALAKYGFIRPAASEDGRETRWTLPEGGIRFSAVGHETASALLKAQVLERDARLVNEYLEREDEFDGEWQDAAVFTSGSVWITPDELRELGREVERLLLRLRRAADERPPDARPVHVVFRAVPRVRRTRRGG